MHNQTTLLQQGQECLRMFYEAIGTENKPNERQFKYTAPRFALGVALTKHLGDSMTSEVLQKDRTTIIHYKRRHEQNLMWWDGYAVLYETATRVCDSYLSQMAKVNRAQYIDDMINQLLKEKLNIQSSINV